jgi:lipopolysaccharide exporter
MKAAQVVSGLGWSASASALNALAQFAFLAVLARMLSPQDFGLVAMAAIALRFVSFFAELGFAQALIQKPKLATEDVMAALLMAAGLGLLLYVGVLMASPLAGAYFRAPELPALLAGFGWSLLLGTVAGLPIALLRRQARFKAVAAIEITAFMGGYGFVGIGAALAGCGVWSLVAATLSQQAVAALLGFATARPRLAWPVPRQAFGHFWRFGSRYSVIGFLEFIFANVEAIVIGRAFGKADLGLFNRAITLTNLPVEQSLNAVNKVMFPALSAWSGDKPRLGDGFLVLLLAVGMVSAALACGLSAAAADVVALLLGARWAAAAPVVAIIAFAVPPMYMYTVCGLTLDSAAALSPKLRLQAAVLVAKVCFVAIAASHGMAGISAAVVAAEWLRFGFGIALVMRTLSLRAASGRLVVAWCAATGAVVYAGVSSGGALAAGAPLGLRFAAEAAGGAIGLSAIVALFFAGFPAYAPLARFATLNAWNGRIDAFLRRRHAP